MPTLGPTIIELFAKRPFSRSLGDEPTVDEMTGEIRTMPTWKAAGADSLPTELLKLDHLDLSVAFTTPWPICGKRVMTKAKAGGVPEIHTWPSSYDHRPSHPYNADTEHDGFSPTRQTLLAQARSTVRCSARHMTGELHPTKNRL